MAELRREVLRLGGELEEARAEIARLEALSHEDALTGLLNRRGFERDLAHAIQFMRRYRSTLGLLMIDLDGFKPINDTLGHAAGDAALQHVAKLFERHTRGSDSVARLGGDEFAVILWQVDLASVRHKAGTLEQMLEGTPVRLEGLDLAVAGSIGGIVVDPAESAEAAIARADRALYARKRERRARPRPPAQAMMSGVS